MNRIVGFLDTYGSYVMDFQILNITYTYPCGPGCAACHPTYTFLNSVCTKNIPTPFPIPNTNTNTTTPSNNTNTTIPNPTTPPNTYTSLSYSELAGKYLSIFMNMALSYVFSLSTIKAMPKFLLIFTVLVNDLPFYKYHRKFQPEYPNSTIIFMEKFDMLKELGVDNFANYLNFPN